jgi:hypothetical protein
MAWKEAFPFSKKSSAVVHQASDDSSHDDAHRRGFPEPKVGELGGDEAVQGGLGRHLGLFSTTFLM